MRTIIKQYALLAGIAAVILPPEILAVEKSSAILSAGYRQDTLDWNINGKGNTLGSEPNILSELTWRDLKILQLRSDIEHSTGKGLYLRGSFGYGWVLEGENQDSDYAGDNRTLEFSRSINGVDGSRVWDIKGGLGYELTFGSQGQHSLIPMLGYGYHVQNLRMTDGRQALWSLSNYQVYDPSATGSVPLGPFFGLDSSYETEWSGPWAGVDMLWSLAQGSKVYARLEYHKVDYYAKANWNLRTVANNPASALQHPVSFEHWADGHGWVMELGWRSQPSQQNWVFGASLQMQQWQTGSGLDRTYGADPAPPCNGNCYGDGILNEVNWRSSALNLTISREFRLTSR